MLDYVFLLEGYVFGGVPDEASACKILDEGLLDCADLHSDHLQLPLFEPSITDVSSEHLQQRGDLLGHPAGVEPSWSVINLML